MFHAWISTDSDNEDQCLACGVVAPDFGTGVFSDHGPLPITCNGPDAARSHHFAAAVEGIECAYCAETITDETLPADVNWECIEV